MTGWALCLLGLLAHTCIAQDWTWDDITPLDEYVHRADPAINLQFIESSAELGATVYVYNLTSQQWMDENYIDRYIWWHYLTIAVPDSATNFQTFHLDIAGGGNDAVGPGNHAYIVQFARETGAVAAQLQQIPNQPVHFADDPTVSRSEDEIIARTWRHYIEWPGDNPNTDVILNLPMTKAGKVAADYVISEVNGLGLGFNLDSYIPSGISKRGWVAWLLAVTDPRVIGTCPTVLDLLGWHENLHHHYMAYGGWSFAFGPYWRENVSMYIDHARAFEIFNDVGIDPLAYNPRLTMPKLLSLATGDEFFLPDDTHYFWNQLQDPKWVTFYENTGHGMGGQGARRDANIQSFFMAVTTGFPIPVVSWTLTETPTGGYIDYTTDTLPNMIQSWWADTTDRTCEGLDINQICRRDFRETTDDVILNPIDWVTNPIEDLGGDELTGYTYRAAYDHRPDAADGDGFRGFMVHAEYDGVDGRILEFTSEIQIMPDYFPYDRCQSEAECLGILK